MDMQAVIEKLSGITEVFGTYAAGARDIDAGVDVAGSHIVITSFNLSRADRAEEGDVTLEDESANVKRFYECDGTIEVQSIVIFPAGEIPQVNFTHTSGGQGAFTYGYVKSADLDKILNRVDYA